VKYGKQVQRCTSEGVFFSLNLKESTDAVATGVLFPVLFLLALLCFSTAAFGQISPGPLSKPHHDLDGPTGCTQCHAVSAGSPNFRCLECHRDIATRIQQRRGLHASYLPAGSPSSSCIRCHSEHNGEEFQIVKWNPTPGAFDHTKTGFVLDGKHAGLTCKNCHNIQKMPPAERASLFVKDFNRTWLGLSKSCTSCHEDKHKGQLGSNCLQCHNTTDWTKTTQFDHSKTRYPLTGAHLQVSCQACHKPGPDGQPQYAGIKFAGCNDCHRDPHKGEFKDRSCESCHNTVDWRKTGFIRGFDHSKTQFPLLGKHRDVSCVACHKSGDFKAVLAFQVCADCHKTDDPHAGQFATRKDGGKCETCHTVEGWKPSTFTVAAHDSTNFPLREKHALVECGKCHIPAGRNTIYKVKFSRCNDCHKDIHNTQFAGAPYLNRCEQCHSETTFKPSTFTIARHQKINFTLTGSHIAVPCIDCHKPLAGSTTVLYHFPGMSCTTCHEDPHHGEFAARIAKVNAAGKPGGCESCHSTKAWNDLAGFDHATTSFPLLGTHRAVACIDCHKPPNLEQTMLHVSFKEAPSQCEDCHENPHGDQFAKSGQKTLCADCHGNTKWKPSLFDHEKTAFSLKGAHENVACGDCHTLVKEENGKKVLYYKPTPTACASCHGGDMKGSGKGKP